jgi:hypothetical protein
VLDGVGGGDTLDGGEGDDVCTGGQIYMSCENQGAEVIVPVPSDIPSPPEV